MLKAHGALLPFNSLSIDLNQALKSWIVLAFGPGNDPIKPALHASITDFVLETRNIGATMAGSSSRDLIEANFVSSLMIKMDAHLRLPNINLQEILLYLCLFAIILFYKPEEIY